MLASLRGGRVSMINSPACLSLFEAPPARVSLLRFCICLLFMPTLYLGTFVIVVVPYISILTVGCIVLHSSMRMLT